MIRIFAKMFVKEECCEAFIEAAAPLVAASREEDGNVFYTLNRSKEDPCVFAFMECWKDAEAIEIHNATDHFTRIVPMLGEMCTGTGDVELYDDVIE